ncbi:DUF2933 domain-containing protein [Chitinimonas naiadis]
MQHDPPPNRHRWVFWGFVVIAAFFLLTEHTAHVLGALPYLLLAACPLMHLFMHHGHGHHHHHHDPSRSSQDEEDRP